MPYVIKATGRAGYVCWLGETNESGFRTFAPRETAGVFQIAEDAQAAIDNLPLAFQEVGLTFSVESAN
jgi:hypothetical protein